MSAFSNPSSVWKTHWLLIVAVAAAPVAFSSAERLMADGYWSLRPRIAIAAKPAATLSLR